jgi:tRNA(Ile)-lysidine synthase
MINKGDKIIIAVSGGPDSICMLHILNSLKQKYDMELFAAHVNHCLRGDDADKDEEYVKDMCNDMGISFYSKKIDLNKYAEDNSLSCETAGREVRYDFFKELMEQIGAHKIALAHNANDQAETILMRLMRGTGIEGLKGIKAVRDSIFIRPILLLNRIEIEDYCQNNNLKPRIDESNLENIYSRNKVRLELIPYIQGNFNRDIVNTLNRFSQLISKDSEFIEEFAKEKYEKVCLRKNNNIIIKQIAFEEKEAIITRIIRNALFELKGNLNNFESIHIYDIISIQNQGTGKKIMLPQQVIAENVYGDIVLYIKDDEETLIKDCIKNNILFKINKSILEDNKDTVKIYIKTLDITVELKIIFKDKVINFNENNLTKYFDYDKIKDEIVARTRQDGDKFIPYGMQGSKKLKDFFMDLKIPKNHRDDIPLLCFDNEIAWVVGYRVGEIFKVTKNTKNIMEVKVKRKGKTE